VSRFRLAFGSLLLAIAGCVHAPPSPTEIARVDQDTARVTRDIAATCLGSGLFKMADGAVARSMPAAELPIDVINAGVDVVCSRPDLFARDAATIEWLARNLRDAIRRRRANELTPKPESR
jgi:hypothetical protein